MTDEVAKYKLLLYFKFFKNLFNRFLGYEFTTYGTQVLSMSEGEFGSRNDAMDMVFPKVRLTEFLVNAIRYK